MGQKEKSAHYQALKAAGVPFSKPYQQYTEDELREAHELLEDARRQAAALEQAPPESDPEPEQAEPGESLDDVLNEELQQPDFVSEPRPVAPPPTAGHGVQPNQAQPGTIGGPPISNVPNPNEFAGQRLNTQAPGEVIRVDDNGRQWVQEEIRKPSYPKPRARRVLRYKDAGVREQETRTGKFMERFEVPGDPSMARDAEVKITLPSYQVGKFIDPRFPMFKVLTYDGNQGFDLFDVENFYGGPELVPAGVKRKYIQNELCYDIRTVVRAIEDEYRQLALQGKV